MSKVNDVQNKIKQMEGGAFQKLFDEYLYKKYKFKNIQTLGSQTATNKTTRGTPDSYVLTDDGKYILICYGHVERQAKKKIEEDIKSCFDNSKVHLEKEKISKIICGYSNTNIHPDEYDKLRHMVKGMETELIGIDTLSHDLVEKYPHIAKDYLNIEIDTYQIFDVDDFIKKHDAKKMNSPLNMEFHFRTEKLQQLIDSINDHKITVVTGVSGIGKTRFVIEGCRKFLKEDWLVYCIESNGQELYKDFPFYINEKGNYLFFLMMLIFL